jgi:glycosyltransferase involved in cell wall biosynthesis
MVVLALQERGYRIAVVTSHGSLELPDLDDYAGIPIYRFPFYAAFAERDIERLAEIHRRLRALKAEFAPDVVHINFLGPSAICHVQTTSAHPAPLMVTLRGMLPDDVLQAGSGYAFALRGADWVTANASAALEQARRHLPQIIPRSSIVYDGGDPSGIAPSPLSFEPPRLLCIGRLAPEKGFDLALSAFALILGRCPTARLVVAGDGPERGRLERQAADLGVAAAVEFVGWVAPKKVQALLNTVTAVIMPSRTEALPLTAVEAGQLARPVVATRVGGVPEVVLDGRSGLLVEPESVSGLAGALTWLLNHPEQAAQMGARARAYTGETFGMQRCVDGYDALYRRLIEARREGARADSRRVRLEAAQRTISEPSAGRADV